MNKTLINNWNNTVKPKDTVYILGDFGDLNYAKFLNGYKIFIRGNYEYQKSEEELKEYFDVVIPSHKINVPIEHDNKLYHLEMTHEPKNIVSELSENHINLFGHIHKLCMIKPYGINVGADCHNFTPISFEVVLHYHNGILNFYDNNVLY